jgi:hypothetical protein
LLVAETLAALGGTAARGEAEPWPLSDQAVGWIRAHLDAASPAERDVVEAASVLGDETDVTILERLAAEARTAVTKSAFLVPRNGGERCRFLAPLARELVYATLSPERRLTLHSRAAAVLGDAGSPSPAELAHRALAASAVGDARRCEHYVSRLVKTCTAADAPVSPSRRPYFVREGDHWAIGFGDRAIRLGDRTGLLYLARLLSRPGVEFAALALGARHRATNGTTDLVGESTLAGERARVRVTRRIRDGIARIARAHPELGAHLERTIRTGARCVYLVDPSTAPRWETRSSV